MLKVKDHQAKEGEPAHRDMHEVDAHHAVAADPERYEIVKEPEPLSVEQRLVRLEREVFPPRDAAAPPAYDEADDE